MIYCNPLISKKFGKFEQFVRLKKMSLFFDELGRTRMLAFSIFTLRKIPCQKLSF